ncbi:MAG: S9 family peptidase, partial [Pseudomonadota bacterium]
MRLTTTAIAAALLASVCSLPAIAEKPTEPEVTETTEVANDPYLWMEEVEGEEALAWVSAQNERSLADIQGHPLYEDNLEKAMDLATSEDRIPYGSVRDGLVYNF